MGENQPAEIVSICTRPLRSASAQSIAFCFSGVIKMIEGKKKMMIPISTRKTRIRRPHLRRRIAGVFSEVDFRVVSSLDIVHLKIRSLINVILLKGSWITGSPVRGTVVQIVARGEDCRAQPKCRKEELPAAQTSGDIGIGIASIKLSGIELPGGPNQRVCMARNYSAQRRTISTPTSHAATISSRQAHSSGE